MLQIVLFDQPLLSREVTKERYSGAALLLKCPSTFDVVSKLQMSFDVIINYSTALKFLSGDLPAHLPIMCSFHCACLSSVEVRVV